MTERRQRDKLRIGAVELQTGFTRDTIHHYVREGLLHPPEKVSATVAWFDRSHVTRLLSIRALRSASLPLPAVKRLLEDRSISSLPAGALEALGRSLAAVGLKEVPRAAVCDEPGRALADRLRLSDRLEEDPALAQALSMLAASLSSAALDVLCEQVAPALRTMAAVESAAEVARTDEQLARATEALSLGLGSLANAVRAEALARRAARAGRRSSRRSCKMPSP